MTTTYESVLGTLHSHILAINLGLTRSQFDDQDNNPADPEQADLEDGL